MNTLDYFLKTTYIAQRGEFLTFKNIFDDFQEWLYATYGESTNTIVLKKNVYEKLRNIDKNQYEYIPVKFNNVERLKNITYQPIIYENISDINEDPLIVICEKIPQLVNREFTCGEKDKIFELYKDLHFILFGDSQSEKNSSSMSVENVLIDKSNTTTDEISSVESNIFDGQNYNLKTSSNILLDTQNDESNLAPKTRFRIVESKVPQNEAPISSERILRDKAVEKFREGPPKIKGVTQPPLREDPIKQIAMYGINTEKDRIAREEYEEKLREKQEKYEQFEQKEQEKNGRVPPTHPNYEKIINDPKLLEKFAKPRAKYVEKNQEIPSQVRYGYRNGYGNQQISDIFGKQSKSSSKNKIKTQPDLTKLFNINNYK